MANIATITTTTNAVVPAIDVRLVGGNYNTLVGSFSVELRGKFFSITGGGSRLTFDLTTDTISINGTSCDYTNVMSTFNAVFIK
jgi:hypothetical protein